MTLRLKPLDRQVVVLTGAARGLGLAVAHMAAERGAALVLAARDEDALERLLADIAAKGGRAVAVVADVADEEDVARIARKAIASFGGFDTWINAAEVAIDGSLAEVPVEDQRRLFDVDYWGVVHGSLTAAKHLRRRGGAVVNIGGALPGRALPRQGCYAAAKQAVVAFTQALRTELAQEGAPISVTLIEPGAARTRAGSIPERLAKAVLRAAERPGCDLVRISATPSDPRLEAPDPAAQAALFDARTRGPMERRAWLTLAMAAGLGFAAARLLRA